MHADSRSDDNAQVSHGHSHGAVDGEILASGRGIRVTKISLAVLLVTAIFQLVVVGFTGSVALLADTVHNFGDAATALPLWAAFTLSRKLPTKRFNYGYGRAEDLAGLLIVLSILATGIFAAYESINRLGNPPEIDYLWVVAVAAVIGFVGNEGVALYRMKVGKEIGSAALVADGHHARVDGLTSLAVLFGALGVWLGYPLADPIVGLVISAAILRIVIETAKSVFSRLLDGVEPEVPDEVRDVASVTDGVREVSEVRVRWLGHKMLAEVNIAVDPDLSVGAGHDIAEDVHHQLLHNLKYLSNATVHVDPVGLAGEEFHRHGLGNTEHQIEHESERSHDSEDDVDHGHSHDQ